MVGKIIPTTSLAKHDDMFDYESNSFLTTHEAKNFVNLPQNAHGS